METTEEKQERQWKGTLPDEVTEAVIEKVGALGIREQLQVVRAVLPQVLAQLPEDERKAFLEDLARPGSTQ